MPWFEYLQKANIWQMDCTTTHIAVENSKGKMELICYHILLFIHVKTRKVVLGGIKENPDGQWVCNVIRSMLGFELEHARAIVMDRDPIFRPVLKLLRQSGIEPHVLPPKSPNLNAYIERFHLTLKSECLSWLFLTSEAELRNTVVEFLYYYNHWRPHQSLGGLPPEPDGKIIKAMNGELKGKIITEERLNGIIRFRYREAA
ncbi:MAG: transposase family protein [Cytophagales bacterium]|nr:transposase family protein [Cytophagales bacterium]